MVDVLVVGGGPAGWALADACACLNLRTALVDPKPDRPWSATYGAWVDELPAGTPTTTRPTSTRVVGQRAHQLRRRYAVLDNTALRAGLCHPDVVVHAGRVVEAVHTRQGGTVRMADGRRLTAAVVVDASGARRALTGGPARGPRAEQTAVGLILPASDARPLIGVDESLFMDWRPRRVGQPATFLYAVPLDADRVLVEETSLARRPGLPAARLRERLYRRLADHGMSPRTSLAEERVRFPVDLPMAGTHRVVSFGAAAGMTHPATGYSLAAALSLAPGVAAELARTLPDGPVVAARAVRRVTWSAAAKAVHRLRAVGLEALLTLPAADMPEFFELFFTLPERLQRAYLSGREDLLGTMAAMGALFHTASPPLRWHLLRHGVTPWHRTGLTG